MVVLVDLNVVLRNDYLPSAGTLKVVNARRPDQHTIITGRNAPEGLIEAADLVAEMTLD